MDGLVFKVEGDEFPFDMGEPMTMDEAMIVHDYSGLTLDQIDDDIGVHPKVLAAFIHIAIARKMPDLKAKEIRRKVGALKAADMVQAILEAEASLADVSPPAPTPTVPGESERHDDSKKPSGEDGPPAGGHSPELNGHSSTGLPPSVTTATSVQETLGA